MVHGGISHVHPNWGNIDNKGKNGNNKFQKEKKKLIQMMCLLDLKG
jgi:hypothetical protein